MTIILEKIPYESGVKLYRPQVSHNRPIRVADASPQKGPIPVFLPAPLPDHPQFHDLARYLKMLQADGIIDLWVPSFGKMNLAFYFEDYTDNTLIQVDRFIDAQYLGAKVFPQTDPDEFLEIACSEMVEQGKEGVVLLFSTPTLKGFRTPVTEIVIDFHELIPHSHGKIKVPSLSMRNSMPVYGFVEGREGMGAVVTLNRSINYAKFEISSDEIARRIYRRLPIGTARDRNTGLRYYPIIRRIISSDVFVPGDDGSISKEDFLRKVSQKIGSSEHRKTWQSAWDKVLTDHLLVDERIPQLICDTPPRHHEMSGLETALKNAVEIIGCEQSLPSFRSCLDSRSTTGSRSEAISMSSR